MTVTVLHKTYREQRISPKLKVKHSPELHCWLLLDWLNQTFTAINTNLRGLRSMQTFSKMSLRNCGALSWTTCWTLRRDFRYSRKRFKKPTKCSAVRMEPGTASKERRIRVMNVTEICTKTSVFDAWCWGWLHLEEFHLVRPGLPGRHLSPWLHWPPSAPPPVVCTPLWA